MMSMPLINDAITSGGLANAIADRFIILALIASRYPRVRSKTQASLFLVYATAWFEQNAYAPLTNTRIDHVHEVLISNEMFTEKLEEVLGGDFVNSLRSSLDDLIERARRARFIHKQGSSYILTDKALNHLMDYIRGSGKEHLSKGYGLEAELSVLEVELNLAP